MLNKIETIIMMMIIIWWFTFNFEVGGGPLGLADAVGDVTGVEAAVVGMDGADEQRAVALEQGA